MSQRYGDIFNITNDFPSPIRVPIDENVKVITFSNWLLFRDGNVFAIRYNDSIDESCFLDQTIYFSIVITWKK